MKTISAYSFCENKTLLAVDDDALNRTFVVDLLMQTMPSMNVLVAKDGPQAMNILGKKSVDIILLDWDMPGMTGLELLKELQKNETWSQIPVVMYTGTMTASENLAKALEDGAVDFLRKPAEPTELLARLSTILRQKETERARRLAEQALLQAQNDFLHKEIELSKQEMSNYLLLLAKKNEVLSDIKDKCEDPVQSKTITPKSIAQHISRLLDQEDYWDDFLNKFNKTDQDFVQKLMVAVPEVSPSELRMAVLIRLGMDNKAIAHLLNISADGVKKSRYRLRKKTILEQDDNLDVFLRTL